MSVHHQARYKWHTLLGIQQCKSGGALSSTRTVSVTILMISTVSIGILSCGGSSNGGDGILGNGDDKGDSGGNGGAGAATQLSTNASMDNDRGSKVGPTFVPYGVEFGIKDNMLVGNRSELRVPPPVVPNRDPHQDPLRDPFQSARSPPNSQEHKLVKVVLGLENVEQPQMPKGQTHTHPPREFQMAVHHCRWSSRCK
nr:hypothetical protein [Tanacetum cinerariifolium]